MFERISVHTTAAFLIYKTDITLIDAVENEEKGVKCDDFSEFWMNLY